MSQCRPIVSHFGVDTRPHGPKCVLTRVDDWRIATYTGHVRGMSTGHLSCIRGTMLTRTLASPGLGASGFRACPLACPTLVPIRRDRTAAACRPRQASAGRLVDHRPRARRRNLVGGSVAAVSDTVAVHVSRDDVLRPSRPHAHTLARRTARELCRVAACMLPCWRQRLAQRSSSGVDRYI